MKANAETVKGRTGRTKEFQHGSLKHQCTVHQVTISGRKGKSPEICSEIRKILIPVLPTPPSYSAIPAGCPQLNSDTAYLETVPQDCGPLPTTSDTRWQVSMELRSAGHLQGHGFIIKGYNSRTARWKGCRRGEELPCPFLALLSPKSPCIHQPGSSLNPARPFGFLWRLCCTGVVD